MSGKTGKPTMQESVTNSVAAGKDPETLAMTDHLVAIVGKIAPTAKDVRISGLVRGSGGFSRENWMFNAEWTEDGKVRRLPLLLRTDPASSPQVTERNLEYRVLAALESCALPSPKAYWLDNEGTLIGRPAMVMERMPGNCNWTVLNGNLPVETRTSLARSFVDALSALHTFDWKTAGLSDVLREPQGNVALFELAKQAERLQRARTEPLPEMDLIHNWLQRKAPAASMLSLVHGDYKPGNALFEGNRFSAILDWETTHIGDPLEDLGWMLMPSRRREQQIRGLWEHDDILAHYEAKTGRRFDPAALRWWIVYSTWKLSITNLLTVAGFIDGQSDRISQMPSWLFLPMFSLMAEDR